MRRKENEITAYHEAGHAVMAMVNGFRVSEIVNQTSHDMHGYVRYGVPIRLTDMDRIKLAMVAAAGTVADFLHWDRERQRLHINADPEEVVQGNFSDQSNCHDYVRGIPGAGGFDHFMELSMYYLKKPEIWEYVEFYAKLGLQNPVINEANAFSEAFFNIRKSHGDEINYIRRYVGMREIALNQTTMG